MSKLTKENNLEFWAKQNGKKYLLAEWDYERNNCLPSEITPKNGKKVSWICSTCKSIFESRVSDRANGHGCPYCNHKNASQNRTNTLITKGDNLLSWAKKNNADYLIFEFDVYKNNCTPDKITPKSAQKYWWICEQGHSYEARVEGRTVHRSGCPYCARQKAWEGNNLEEFAKRNKMEYLISEFDIEKNGCTPEQVMPKSGKKAFWTCDKCGNSWNATISNRTSGAGCPYCAGKLAWEGNNLFSWAISNNSKYLISEWDYNKNDCLPNDVTFGSHKKRYWICSKCKTSFEQSPNSRTCHKQGCPVCAGVRSASAQEKLIYLYLNLAIGENYLIVPNDRKVLKNNTELDIYIPDLKIGIEYDGCFYHDKNNSKKEKLKNKLCKDKGIDLIRVREKGLSNMQDCSLCLVRKNSSDADMDICIADILNYIITEKNVKISFNIYDVGKEMSFINCKRDKQKAICLRDEMAQKMSNKKIGDVQK